MDLSSRTLPGFPALLLGCLLLAGCTAAREAGRGEGIGVKVPAVESFEFTRKPEAPAPPGPAPFFEDDEYRNTGRWLTLFELEFPEGATPPHAPAEQRP